MSKILGIDLGTTNSEVAVVRDGKPVVLDDGRRLAYEARAGFVPVASAKLGADRGEPQAAAHLPAGFEAGFGGQSLDPGAAEALCTLDGYPAPFPIFSAALRQLAAGQIPAIPGALPGELQEILTTIVEAIRQPTQN